MSLRSKRSKDDFQPWLRQYERVELLLSVNVSPFGRGPEAPEFGQRPTGIGSDLVERTNEHVVKAAGER